VPTTRHLGVVGMAIEQFGRTCKRQYQHIRVAVHCDGEQPDELVTIVTDYNKHYAIGQRVNIERNRAQNIVSYRIVGDDE
jgi:hypothetical protein